ncbi:MAG: hypothetical protein J1F18_15400 [Lachnospiraceae bacterium]|nr:hypothetical protein [Lachnospiraceae bacterium]
MKKKFVSILLCIAMSVSIAAPAMAANIEASDHNQNESVSFLTSSTGRMDITYNPPNDSNSTFDNNQNMFEIKQYENDELIQTVIGSPGGDKLIVQNYEEGEIRNEEIILVADRVIVHKTTSEPILNVSAYTASYGSLLGTIVYNKVIGGTIEEQIKVYSKLTDQDTESYTINGKKTDTLAIIAGLIASVLSVFVPAATIGRQIAIAIISGLGGSVVGGAIGIAFSEDVAVNSKYYTLTGYHAITNRYSSGYDGVARQVCTKNSDYYNKWFYDGFTPYNWKDGDDLAILLWNSMIGDIWPYVKAYT